MKKLLICLLLLPSLAWSAEPIEVARMNPYILGGGVAAAASTFCSSATATASTTGLLCDEFGGNVECTSGYSSNCRAAWTVGVGTPDYDYATSPAPIEGNGASDGNYSMMLGGCINGADTRVYRTFTPTDGQPQELYFEFILTEDGSAPGSFVIAILRRSTSNYCTITLNSNKTLKATVGGGTGVSTVATVTEDVKTYVWVRFLKGGGDNALCSVGFNTTASRPTSGNNYAESTDGTVTLDANRVELWGDYTSATGCNDIIFDKVFVDDATIGDTP